MGDTRPDWDTYFMTIAMMAATRSTCLRRRVGAVITRDRQIVSMGYNGAPLVAVDKRLVADVPVSALDLLDTADGEP